MAVIRLATVAPEAAAPLHFGAYTLLARERRLLLGDSEVPLGPRAFDLLQVLAARPGQLVTKEELLAAVWRGLVVEEGNLHVQVSQLRKAIGSDAIATVPGLGYRFTARPADRVQAASNGIGSPTLRLSVIVLPFVENGATAEQDYFADAITDDITTQLSKIRGSTVIGSQTALTFKRQAPDLAAIARELGVRYVLQGRIERCDACVEVNARLSDAATGTVIWSDTIVVGHAALREIRRELVARLAVALELELQHAEVRRTSDTASPHALDLVMQGRCAGGSNFTRAHYEHALACADQALALEPDNAQALGLRASTLGVLASSWPGPDIAQLVACAEADALRALSLDSLEASSYRTLSVVRQLQYRIDEALEAVDTSLELNPNDPRAHSWRGFLMTLSGRSELAIEPLQRALRLSPHDPHRWMTLLRLGAAWMYLGEAAKALPWFDQMWALHPHWYLPLHRAAVLARLGDRKRALELRPQFGLEDPDQPRRWNRTSRHPEFLRQVRDHLYGPLVEAGILDDFSFYEAWAARQRRGGI